MSSNNRIEGLDMEMIMGSVRTKSKALKTKKSQSTKQKLHKKVKKQLESLQHPSDSVEFMEHMLQQTRLVNSIKTSLRRFSSFSVILTTFMTIYSVFTWYVSLSQTAPKSSDTVVQSSSQSDHHGPSVRSSNTQEMFETLQNVQDSMNEETQYDTYVNQQTGDIQVNQICETISVAVWGLVMAKARATFALSDLTDSKKIKSKFSQLIYLGIMVVFAQGLKANAENNYINHFIEQVETKIDSAVNEPLVSSHGPQVQSSQIDLSAISQYRKEQIGSLIQSGEVNDFNIMQKASQFNLNDVQAEIAMQSQNSQASNVVVPTESKKKAASKKFSQYWSLLIVSGISGYCFLLANQFHKETEQLQNLNSILKNKKAKVAVGEKQGSKILKNINTYKKQKDESDSESDDSSTSEQEEETKYVAPSLEDIEARQTPKEKNQNDLNYSLCEFDTMGARAAPPTVMYTQEQVNALMNQPRVQTYAPVIAANPLACYSLPPLSTPVMMELETRQNNMI